MQKWIGRTMGKLDREDDTLSHSAVYLLFIICITKEGQTNGRLLPLCMFFRSLSSGFMFCCTHALPRSRTGQRWVIQNRPRLHVAGWCHE